MPTQTSHQKQIHRLRNSIFRRWWAISGGLWLTIGLLSLWRLQNEFELLREHFTWTSLRYALIYNRLEALGLSLCVGLTVALLVAESRHIIFGLTDGERQRLENTLFRIHQQGESHPLWQKIIEADNKD